MKGINYKFKRLKKIETKEENLEPYKRYYIYRMDYIIEYLRMLLNKNKEH